MSCLGAATQLLHPPCNCQWRCLSEASRNLCPCLLYCSLFSAGAAAAHSRLGLPFQASTTILLPLKHSLTAQQQQQQQPLGGLRQRFQDLRPTLLLFLEKLACICITDVLQPHCSTVMVRQQLGRHLVELRHGPAAQHAEHWLVVRWVYA